MKKLIYSLTTLLCLVLMVSPASAGSPIPVMQEDDPPPSLSGEIRLYLPMVVKPSQFFTISGQVKDSDDLPISGVTITSDSGESTFTDINGVFLFQVPDGERQITASKPGFELDPSPAWLKLDQNMYNINFSAAAGCHYPIPNPSFEIVPLYWNPISGYANGYTPYYAMYEQAHTGVVSGFTGIKPWWPNKPSWSRWRSHEIYIPSTATSADVNLHFWPWTTEVPLAPEMEVQTPLKPGMNMDDLDLPEGSDFQYMAVINTNNDILGVLWTARLNDQAWIYTGVMDLLPWMGHTIKLEFGSYNDGIDGVTSAYFDDVFVSVCKPDVPAPTCSNLLVNPNFEAGTGWTISASASPSSYTSMYYFSPFHSMLSGIPVEVPYPAPGEWRIGEFHQNVTIPANAYYARLKVRLLPRTSDPWGYHIEEQAAMEAMDKQFAPDRTVSQYGHVRNEANTTTLRQLFKWFPINSAYWQFRDFNMMEFRGQTVGILFGAMDDGFWGNTALYVDDAYLYVCTP